MVVKSNPTSARSSVHPLAGSDFIIEPISPKRQAVILIYGEGGTGKTTFCTRFAPDPVTLINFDGRAAFAVEEAKKSGREIYPMYVDVAPKRLTPEETRKRAIETVDKVMRNLEIAVEQSLKGNVRSILLDTGTELSEMLKLSFDGVVETTKAGAYGKDKDFINRQWWKMFQIARSGNAHLIITARAKEIWIKNPNTGHQEATGRFTYRCPSVINDGADWAGHIRFKKNKLGRLKKEFELEVTKAGVNVSELCEVYDESKWGELGPFVYGCLLQYPESDLTDWA